MTTALAPAKINLCLDILRRREDGFHEIATLFAEVGVADTLHAEAAAEDSLAVDGPFADGVPADASNLVLRAVAALRAELGICAPWPRASAATAPSSCAEARQSVVVEARSWSPSRSAAARTSSS